MENRKTPALQNGSGERVSSRAIPALQMIAGKEIALYLIYD